MGAGGVHGVQRGDLRPGPGRYTQRQTVPDAPTTVLSDFLDRHYPDERIEHVYPNAILVEE